MFAEKMALQCANYYLNLLFNMVHIHNQKYMDLGHRPVWKFFSPKYQICKNQLGWSSWLPTWFQVGVFLYKNASPETQFVVVNVNEVEKIVNTT